MATQRPAGRAGATVGWSEPIWGAGLEDWFRWLVLDGRGTPYYLPRATARYGWSLYLAHGVLPAARSDPHVATRATLDELAAWIADHGADLP
jgi:hypothetical protein